MGSTNLHIIFIPTWPEILGYGDGRDGIEVRHVMYRYT